MRVRSTRSTGVRYQRGDTFGGEQRIGQSGQSPEMQHSKLMQLLVYNSTLARCHKIPCTSCRAIAMNHKGTG